MRKLMNFAYTSAIALLSAGLFAACSSSDDTALDPKQDITPQKDEVNVNFVFNVSTSNEATMRMTAANTQATLTQPFRGITNAYLGAFSLANDGKYMTDPATAVDKLHSLGPVIGAGKLDPNLEQATSDVAKSRRVLQLSLASGTNSLVFWGKAPKTGTDLAQGKITMDIQETPENTTISMCKIVPEKAYEDAPGIDKATLKQYQGLIAAILSRIVETTGIKGQEVTFGSETKTVTLNWKDYVTVSGEKGSYKLAIPDKDPADANQDLCLLGERLAYTFKQLNTVHADELRAGYGAAISYMMSDVMANIDQVVNATPLNLCEVAAQKVAKAVKDEIEKYFDPNHDYAWKAVADVKAAATYVLGTDKNLVTKDLNQFPANFNLPLGSVILQLGIEAATSPATGYNYAYSYLGEISTYAMGAASQFNPDNYMFPAELCYFGNSPIRVTDQTLVAGDYPDGVADWEATTSWASKGWVADSHVTSSTRSVAMKDNINYGTALLKSQVRYGAQVLLDNNHSLQRQWNGADEPNNTIDVTERDDAFVLTGVLVGGQNPEVGWNYIAKASTTGFGAMVYDKAEKSKDDYYIEIPKAEAATGGNPSEALYTLLWDNWDASVKGQKQRDVYVAVEFKNNSKNFFGQNNLIRNGATFYIVGKLDPDKRPSSLTDVTDDAYVADKSLGITWPTKYALPPYDTDGKSIKERRVFMQDFLTTATFVINETSLQHALVAVPDLRSGQISLGLSVDLNWRTGLVFDNVILGEQ